jgi:hypothetical protein
MANHILTMRGSGKVVMLLILCLALLAGTASAGYVTQTSSLMTHSPLGMLFLLVLKTLFQRQTR